MGRTQTGHALERRRRRQHRPASRIVYIESELGSQNLLDVLRSLSWIAPVNSLGEIRRHLHRISERAHRIENRIRTAVHLDNARDRGICAIVLAIDVVQNFFAAVVLDVDNDVGSFSLSVDANLREKALEQKAVAHRVDGRDGETIRDGRIGGTAAALAKNSLLSGEMHRVPHHQKESREAQFADDAELVLQLRGLLLINVAPTLPCTLEYFLTQERVVVVAGRNGKIGKRRPHPR